jgi:cephalosporin hydroxylase
MDELVEIGNSLYGIPRDRLDEAGGLFPPSIYYKFFELVAAKYKPNRAVVLGVCGGGDCYHLCKGNSEGKVIGVDITYDHPEQLEYIKAHCPGFTFHLGDSVASASEVGGPIDFLFIDTSHTLEATCMEFEAWKPYLAPGALICFDDLFRTEMKGVWESLPEPKTRMDHLHDGSPDAGGGFGWLIHQG